MNNINFHSTFNFLSTKQILYCWTLTKSLWTKYPLEFPYNDRADLYSIFWKGMKISFNNNNGSSLIYHHFLYFFFGGIIFSFSFFTCIEKWGGTARVYSDKIRLTYFSSYTEGRGEIELKIKSSKNQNVQQMKPLFFLQKNIPPWHCNHYQ